jgi:hypothetical protein
VTQIFLDQIDIGDDQTIEIPVVQEIDHYSLFGCTEKVVAGAEVAVAEFPAIKGNTPHIDPAVLGGMEQASHETPAGIEKSRVFTAIDLFKASVLIFHVPDGDGECRQVLRTSDVATEPLRPQL